MTAATGALALFGVLALPPITEPTAPSTVQALVRSASVAGLLGSNPAAVRARLKPISSRQALAPALEIGTPGNVITFFGLGALLIDPVAVDGSERRRQGDNPAVGTARFWCETRVSRGDGSTSAAYDAVLMFRNDRLERVYAGAGKTRTKPRNFPRTAAGWQAYAKQPRTSPFIRRGGDLPLADGLEFIARWDKVELVSGDMLNTRCERPPMPLPARKPPTPSSPFSNPSTWQALALAPFAVVMPAKNRQRVAARERGIALVAGLHVGARLREAPEAFARRPGVQINRGPDPAYVVLSINMGDRPNNNLANTNDVALIGVRGRVVEWLSRSAHVDSGAGAPLRLNAGLLCLDRNGVPGEVRPGCTDWGRFEP